MCVEIDREREMRGESEREGGEREREREWVRWRERKNGIKREGWKCKYLL